MMVLVFILAFFSLALCCMVAACLHSRRALLDELKNARLERDRAEARLHICEQASGELQNDYYALRDEWSSLNERVKVAEGKLSRKGLGKKGSKRV